MTDYSSRDTDNLNSFLQSIGQEFSTRMLNAGVDKDLIRNLSENQLLGECDITNSIHRLRILDAKNMQHNQFSSCEYESPDKSLDVFISYRRSNSQLASLLKVHLQLRGFTVFIDVELKAGKFNNNLLQAGQTLLLRTYTPGFGEDTRQRVQGLGRMSLNVFHRIFFC